MYSLNTGQDRISDDHKPSNTQIHLKSDKRLNNLIVVRHASWSSVQKESRAGVGVWQWGRGVAGGVNMLAEAVFRKEAELGWVWQWDRGVARRCDPQQHRSLHHNSLCISVGLEKTPRRIQNEQRVRKDKKKNECHWKRPNNGIKPRSTKR